ncbi:Dak1 domain-containing protein [Dipodascopsis uninucleata]
MSRFKSFATDPNEIVLSSLKGLVASNPKVALIEKDKVILRQSPKAKVIVISGGGSGHEPTHAGFVGEGMLDVAVCGSLFASPSTKQIISAVNQFDGTNGFVIIVKNYTGDVLHFGLAAEKLKAKGKNVSLVTVGDDVSVGKTKGGLVGRRGLAGTVLVHKTVGAAAEAGLSLPEIEVLATAVTENIATIGASLDHCTVPGRDPTQQLALGPDELEIGMGIHNEPGVEKVSPLPTREGLVEKLLSILVSGEDPERSFVSFSKSDDVILLVNNLGGISNLELGSFVQVAASRLNEVYGLNLVRIFSGTFTTALDGPGFSLTLLNLTKAGEPSILEYIDAPTLAPGWTIKNLWTGSSSCKFKPRREIQQESTGPVLKTDPERIRALLVAARNSIVKYEPKITLYDTVAGDGDCGETLLNGSSGILSALENRTLHLDNAVQLALEIVDIVEDCMGGTSGGIYAIFLSALAQALGNTAENGTLDIATLAKCLKFALDTLYRYTRARPGDRTLIDALAPFVTTLVETKDFNIAVDSAKMGFEATRKLQAKFGRASYVAQSAITNFDNEGGLPDPGALGVVAILEGFLSTL